MIETKVAHTLGPWSYFAGKLSDGGKTMKFLVGADGQGFAHTVGLQEPTDTANANLIAAAPEMLGLLKAIVKSIECCEICNVWPHRKDCALVATIAKAEGK